MLQRFILLVTILFCAAGSYASDQPQAPATQPKTDVPFSAPRPLSHLPVRQRAQQAKSFSCYYGFDRTAELSYYDLVIVIQNQQKRADIEKLQSLGVVVTAYITVGEDFTVRPGDGSGPGGAASWYFDKDADGKPDKNLVWNSVFANAADPKWRQDRVDEARRLIETEGYDGIFLDTLDTPAFYPESADGMVQLVREFRDNFPDKVIILNQGFTQFDKLGPLADAVMIESFTCSFNFETKSYFIHPPNVLDGQRGKIQKHLLPVLKTHPIPVLSLEYARPEDAAWIQTAYDRNATFGFLTYVAPITPTEIYHLDVTPRPDAKYLGRLADPELLAYTLTTDANGFPAGTKLVPSGTFLGYTLEPLIDGIKDRAGLEWVKAAWASNEDGDDTWLEIRLPAPRTGGSFKLSLAAFNVSRDFTLQAKCAGVWKTIARKTGNTQAVVTCDLPTEPYTAIRIHQKPGGGSARRPDLLWIAQVELELGGVNSPN